MTHSGPPYSWFTGQMGSIPVVKEWEAKTHKILLKEFPKHPKSPWLPPQPHFSVLLACGSTPNFNRMECGAFEPTRKEEGKGVHVF